MDVSTSFSFSQCAKDNNKNKSEYPKNEADIKKLKKMLSLKLGPLKCLRKLNYLGSGLSFKKERDPRELKYKHRRS